MLGSRPGATQKGIVIQRNHERFRTQTGWLESYHSFSFGPHDDPENRHHGLLLVHNEDWIQPGTGFPAHSHRDMEIVTWVLSGALAHTDSTGREGVVTPGLAQRMTAGTGIAHSERNPSVDEPVHLVQMWVVPDQSGLPPSYEQRDLSGALARGGLVPLASGRGHEHAVRIHQRGATLWGGRLKHGETVVLPEAPFVFAYVARGEARLEDGGSLRAGDAARLIHAGAVTLQADATAACEVLVWEMHATIA